MPPDAIACCEFMLRSNAEYLAIAIVQMPLVAPRGCGTAQMLLQDCLHGFDVMSQPQAMVRRSPTLNPGVTAIHELHAAQATVIQVETKA